MALFGSKQEDRSLGIDIGKSSIKAVQLKKEGEKVKLETYGEIALGPYNDLVPGKAVHLGEEKTIEVIVELFKQAKITSKHAFFSVDPSSTFVTTLPIPRPKEAKDVAAAIAFEARKFLPVSVSEVAMDHWFVPEGMLKEDEKTVNVVLAAIKNDTIALYSRLVSRLGIPEPFFEVEGFGLVRALKVASESFVMIVDIGAQFTTVTLVYKGIILDIHLIPRGSQDTSGQLSKALVLPEELAEEIKRSSGYYGNTTYPYAQEVVKLSTYPLFGDMGRLLLMYERKYNKVVDKVILTGGGARTPGVLDACREVIRSEVSLAKPFATIESPAFLHDMLERVGPTYAVAVGLALKGFEK